MEGWNQRHGFEHDGNIFALDYLSTGLSFRDEPLNLKTRVGLRRQPIRVHRFGKGGTASLRVNWPAKIPIEFWTLLGAAFGKSVNLSNDIPVDASSNTTPVDLFDVLPGISYELAGAVASNINISVPAEGPASIEFTYVVKDFTTNMGPLDGIQSPVNTEPLAGAKAGATLGGNQVDIFDIQIRFSRDVNLAGYGPDGIATRYTTGQWQAEFQLGAYFENDNLYAIARDGDRVHATVTFGGGPGSAVLEFPKVVFRPSSPDIQRDADAVIRVFLQPLLEVGSPTNFSIV